MRFSLVVLGALAMCNPPFRAIEGTQVKMDFARPAFWDAPFPSDDLLKDGHPDLLGFATRDVPLIAQVRAIAARANGFATTGAIFFQLTGAIDGARLPDLATTLEASSPVQLIELGTGKRYPVQVSFTASSGPYGANNHLVLLPLQGMPLKPGTRYAAVVRRSLTSPELGVSQTMADIASGVSLIAPYNDAARALPDPATIAGLAVFTTGRPTDELAAFAAAAAALPAPTVKQPLTLTQTFADYCVYESTIAMPNWQRGTPPYSSNGGLWPQSPEAGPDRYEDARLLLTVPKGPMPAAGWPIVDFIGTGAGGERALVERGVWGPDGGLTSGEGSGPAMNFARAGFAGVTVDGPLWGLRNTTHGDEDYLIFNLNNLPALRDNLRQSALELTLHPGIIGALSLDASACGGSAATTFDLGHLAIWGHSMGASILPLAIGSAPRFGAIILSGAGGSWIENIVYKQKPLEVRPIAELLAQIPAGTMTPFDPVLTLVQWAAESADAQVYGEALRSRHVLMEQGIVDHYILPNIANATSLSVKLDLANPPHDDHAELLGSEQLRLEDLLQFSGATRATLPASGNLVVQHHGDGVQDAHEVIYQLDGAMLQYRCFLKTWASGGAPIVVPPDAAGCP